MDATSVWPAVRALRAWEGERLAIGPGERLVDVGCGPGDAAVAPAGSGATVVALDIDPTMLATARTRIGSLHAICAHAAALPLRDASCAAARSERTLQWVPDPGRVVAELHRVVRGGGRVSLIDTDWSTFAVETGDPAVADAVRTHVAVERNRPSHVGRRLGDLLADAGFVDVEETSRTHDTTEWDGGLPPLAGLADDLDAAGEVDEADGFVTAVEDAAGAGRLHVALTIYSVAGRRP